MTTKELVRNTYTTSRLLEFFSEPELTKQIGHERERWPAAILKELIDNALDACESSGVDVPKIEVEIGNDFFTVADNGPGIPPDTIVGSLDYSIRVSDKSYYVSPTRGQQGNALKTLWAAPFVFADKRATIDVEARGVRHTVKVSLDRIAGEPKIEPTTAAAAEVKTGTFWRVGWPRVEL